jgi:hypothetical protein
MEFIYTYKSIIDDKYIIYIVFIYLNILNIYLYI